MTRHVFFILKLFITNHLIGENLTWTISNKLLKYKMYWTDHYFLRPGKEGGLGYFLSHVIFFSPFFSRSFFGWAGIACARIFFYIKNKKIYILESTCSILPNGTRCITFFQSSSFGNCPKPPPFILKIMVRS